MIPGAFPVVVVVRVRAAAAAAASSPGAPDDLEWAPHHLGVWPTCNLAAAQQEQMPLEESGNLLLMVAAVAKAQSGDVAWLTPFWPVLNRY